MAENLKPAVVPNSAPAGQERRLHERLPASRVKDLSVLESGRPVVLQDISRSGARFQGESRLLPGATIALRLVTPDGVFTVRSKVVRSRLVRMGKGGTGYEAAVAFSELLPQVTLAAAGRSKPDPAAAGPTVGAATGSLTIAAPACGQVADDASPAEKAVADTASDEDGDLPLMLLTASINHSIAELHEGLTGNEW